MLRRWGILLGMLTLVGGMAVATVNITGSAANGAALGNAGGVTQIIMVDSAGRDKDTVSSLSGGANFSARWLRSN